LRTRPLIDPAGVTMFFNIFIELRLVVFPSKASDRLRRAEMACHWVIMVNAEQLGSQGTIFGYAECIRFIQEAIAHLVRCGGVAPALPF
jgi:hypothetical protein